MATEQLEARQAIDRQKHKRHRQCRVTESTEARQARFEQNHGAKLEDAMRGLESNLSTGLPSLARVGSLQACRALCLSAAFHYTGRQVHNDTVHRATEQ